MDEHSFRAARKISTSSLYQSATFRNIFTPVKLNLCQELFKNYPENTLAEKLIKLRLSHNLDRKPFAHALDFHFDTVQRWEIENVMPKPENIKIIAEFYDRSLGYFHEYYEIYYSNYSRKIKVWRDKNNYTYSDMMRILNISHSGFGRLLNGRIALSYEMYLKMKKALIF